MIVPFVEVLISNTVAPSVALAVTGCPPGTVIVVDSPSPGFKVKL